MSVWGMFYRVEWESDDLQSLHASRAGAEAAAKQMIADRKEQDRWVVVKIGDLDFETRAVAMWARDGNADDVTIYVVEIEVRP